MIVGALACAWLLGGRAGAGAAPAEGQSAGRRPHPVLVEFFYEAGCEECERVEKNILPVLTNRYSGQYRLVGLELGTMSNYVRLVEYQDQCSTQKNERVYMAVNGANLMQGYDELEARLFATIDQCLATERVQSTNSVAEEQQGDPESGQEVLLGRLGRFSWVAVAVAGLVDGLNPCAFSSLVFFMSLLAVAKVRGRVLLLTGISFCLASFLAYFAVGFGLLKALHAFWGFGALRQILEIFMVGILLLFAWLSFRDAIRYRASGDSDAITMKLPESIRRLTHRVMQKGVKTHHVVAMAFAVGVLVTALETVCTGQLYVPTIVFVVKSGQHIMEGLAYLVLYNLMFVTPLVVVFALTYAGMAQGRLIEWSVRNVVVSKCLLGALFVIMALLFVVL